jgi:hypothetical protein
VDLIDETLGGLRPTCLQDQEPALSKITRANNNGKIQLTDNKSYAMYYINLHFHI